MRTSFVVHIPKEMCSPPKLALLMLMTKGWVVQGCFLTKAAFERRIRQRHSGDHGFSGFYYGDRRSLRIKSSDETMKCWRMSGMVEKAQIDECSTRFVWKITPHGEKFLSELAPEVLRASVAYARAMILSNVIENRRRRRENELAKEREAELLNARKKKGRHARL